MNAYVRVMESAAVETDGVGLVSLMCRELRLSLEQASGCIAGGDHFGRAKALSRALAIVGELSRSLNEAASPELSDRLKEVYSYVTTRILEVNAKPVGGGFAECIAVVRTLESAWGEIHGRTSGASSDSSGGVGDKRLSALSICA